MLRARRHDERGGIFTILIVGCLVVAAFVLWMELGDRIGHGIGGNPGPAGGVQQKVNSGFEKGAP